jgi:hypothetical protein
MLVGYESGSCLPWLSGGAEIFLASSSSCLAGTEGRCSERRRRWRVAGEKLLRSMYAVLSMYSIVYATPAALLHILVSVAVLF